MHFPPMKLAEYCRNVGQGKKTLWFTRKAHSLSFIYLVWRGISGTAKILLFNLSTIVPEERYLAGFHC